MGQGDGILWVYKDNATHIDAGWPRQLPMEVREMSRQHNEFREMQRLSSAAAPYHMHMMVKMEQMRDRLEDAEASRALVVARRQAARERANGRRRLWGRLQAMFRPAPQVEPEPC